MSIINGSEKVEILGKGAEALAVVTAAVNRGEHGTTKIKVIVTPSGEAECDEHGYSLGEDDEIAAARDLGMAVLNGDVSMAEAGLSLPAQDEPATEMGE